MTDPKKDKFIIDFLSKIFEIIGIDVKIETEDTVTKGTMFNLITRDSPTLIGKDGSVLKSLEKITREAVDKEFYHEAIYRFGIDVDDYVRKREWYLKESIKPIAKKVSITGTPYRFQPMPNYERKLIHTTIEENYKDLISESVGKEPKRYLVLSKKPVR